MPGNLKKYSESHLRRLYKMHGNNPADKTKEEIIDYFLKRAEQGDLHVLDSIKVWVDRWEAAGE